MSRLIHVSVALLLVAVAKQGLGDEATSPVPQERAASALDRNKVWLLIIVGHPGDDAYEKQFNDFMKSVSDTSRNRLQIAEDRLLVWSGEGDSAEDGASQGPATGESLSRDIAALRTRVDKQDELWVVVAGHAHAQGAKAKLNLPGADIDTEEFAKLFAEFPCRRTVFLITTALSGRFLEPLSAPQRVVVAAAAHDESNATLFPAAFAAQLEALGKGDADRPPEAASISLLDLCRATVADVESRYEADELILTEHALLDDNGDGRGTEIQSKRLSPTPGSQRELENNETSRSDGALAAFIRLELSPNGSSSR